ncbi:MAG: hypothetical protein AAFP97_07365 [Pseudomonadota bacterium]
MAGYRLGDVQTPHGTLRLTVGALAELSSELDAESPKQLAERLRQLTPETSRILLAALVRPFGEEGSVSELDNAELARLMPAATQCILNALEPRT